MRPWEPAYWLPTMTSTSFSPNCKPIDEDKENKKQSLPESVTRKRRHSSSDPLNLVVNPSNSRCSHDETHDVDSMPPPIKCPRIDDGLVTSSSADVACHCSDHNNNHRHRHPNLSNKAITPNKKDNCNEPDGDCRHGKLVVTPSGSGANGKPVSEPSSNPNGTGYADFSDYVDFFRQQAASAEEEDNAMVPCKRPVMPRNPEPGWDDRLIERIQNYRALKHLQLGVLDFRRQYRNGFR
uniref:INCENP_ARK-bind domain-containing protein n=1 Tax=Panagrellus redivivus TaxID=6233 RepID=A0A7E4W8A2_PANRE